MIVRAIYLLIVLLTNFYKEYFFTGKVSVLDHNSPDIIDHLEPVLIP